MQLFSPTSRRDAVDLIQSFRTRPDTPGQRLLFGQPSLDRLFDNGQRAPERVWAVRADDDVPAGIVAGRLIGDLALVDLIALPEDPAAAGALVDAVTSWARTAPETEVSFEAPYAPEPLAEPGAARVVEAFGRAGWRVLVTRNHFHLSPADVAIASAALPLHTELVRAEPEDRDRLVALMAKVLPGSLDVRDRDAVAEHGLQAAASRAADELLEADPIEYIRFAVVDGEDAGMVSWRLMPNGTGYVLNVGVVQSYRGRGLGGELVAAATRDLVADGAQVLVADTDDDNIGMIRGFARAGWHPTQSRIDLTLAERR